MLMVVAKNLKMIEQGLFSQQLQEGGTPGTMRNITRRWVFSLLYLTSRINQDKKSKLQFFRLNEKDECAKEKLAWPRQRKTHSLMSVANWFLTPAWPETTQWIHDKRRRLFSPRSRVLCKNISERPGKSTQAQFFFINQKSIGKTSTTRSKISSTTLPFASATTWAPTPFWTDTLKRDPPPRIPDRCDIQTPFVLFLYAIFRLCDRLTGQWHVTTPWFQAWGRVLFSA